MIKQQNFRSFAYIGLLAAMIGLLAILMFNILMEDISDKSITYFLIISLGLLVFIPIIYRFIHHTFDLAEPGIWFALYYFVHFGVRAV